MNLMRLSLHSVDITNQCFVFFHCVFFSVHNECCWNSFYCAFIFNCHFLGVTFIKGRVGAAVWCRDYNYNSWIFLLFCFFLWYQLFYKMFIFLYLNIFFSAYEILYVRWLETGSSVTTLLQFPPQNGMNFDIIVPHLYINYSDINNQPPLWSSG